MKRRLLLTFLLATPGLTSLAPPAWTQGRPGTRPGPPLTQIHGQVRITNGPTAPQGITVSLEAARAGLIAQTQTDSHGNFSFSQIPLETYIIKVRYPGYEELSREVNLTFSPTAYEVIELKPLPKDREKTQVPPRGPGDSVSVHALNVPEGAQKELEKGQKLLLDEKDSKGSIAHFLKAVQIHPSFAPAYTLLGTAYMDQKKWKEAQAALEKAISLDETSAPAYLALGFCHNLQGQFAFAEKPLVRGLELDPKAAQGHYELGRAYWALGRWPDAERHARKAEELAPDFAPTYVLMGNIMLRKRDAHAALKEFQEYLHREPKGPLAAPTREMVAKIEKALAGSQ